MRYRPLASQHGTLALERELKKKGGGQVERERGREQKRERADEKKIEVGYTDLDTP